MGYFKRKLPFIEKSNRVRSVVRHRIDYHIQEVIKLKARLTVALDLGASLTKGVYSYSIEGGSYREGIKTTCPIVRQLIQSKYKTLLDLADDNSSLVAFGETYWLVGEAARGPTLTISATQSKRKTAIAKSLAFVGQLVRELNNQGVDQVYLTFGLLLPLDEFGDRQELEQQLQDALWEFEYNGVTLKTVLSEKAHVSPEGYGIAQTVDTQTAGVIIYGHRDVTWVHVEGHSVIEGRSKTLAGWGMHRLIQEAEYTFKDELRAAAAIFAAGKSLKDKPLLTLVTEAELPRLKVAISEARQQIWMELTQKLMDYSLGEVEKVWISGGNAYYWKSDASSWLGNQLDRGKPLLSELEQRFVELSKSPLLYRCADNYAFWRTLPEVTKTQMQEAIHV